MNPGYTIARNHAALLDLGGEGRIRINGPSAEQALNACFSMDLEIVLPWKGVTGLFLTDQGGVRAIVTVVKGDDEYFVFTEAKTATSLLDYLRDQLSGADVEIEDLTQHFGWICVLGPKAQNAMALFAGEDILGLPYLGFEENAKLDAKLFRMGFCGEFEYRILCPLERCEQMIQSFLESGEEFQLELINPNVMQVLMLEMRSLGIDDIPDDADPIQAGLHWMVNFRKAAYPGCDVVVAAKAAPKRRALMVLLEKKGIARVGDRLIIEGQDFGFLAHVEYSPVMEREIALAYVDPELGWVGVSFQTAGEGGGCGAKGVSAPLFVTKTVSNT